MTDIVERLREHAATSSYLTECRPRGLICEAADEIERLRAALQTAADALQEAGCSYAWAAAHAALLRGRHD